MECHQKMPHLIGHRGKYFIVLQCDYVQFIYNNCFQPVMNHIYAFTASEDFH